MSADLGTGIPGYCPMGCGQTLFRASGGYVTCRLVGCPRPDAVSTLLEDRETEHIVEFRDTTFTIRHPLREHIVDDLMTCELHEYCTDLNGPPVQPGRYRVRPGGPGRWTFEALPGGAT